MAVFYTKDQVDSLAITLGDSLRIIKESLRVTKQELEIQKSICKNLVLISEPKNFKFSITPSDQNSGVYRKITQFFDKNLSNYTADWTLLKNGVLLANSSGIKTSESSVVISLTDIIINTTENVKSDYELITYATYLGLEDLDSNEDVVIIESYGQNTKNCKLNIKGYLSVPESLPEGLEDLSGMFAGAIKFNQNISGWDISNVLWLDEMFYNCFSFNQDLSSWDISNIPTEPVRFFEGTSSWILPKPVWNWTLKDFNQFGRIVELNATKTKGIGLVTSTVLCSPTNEEIVELILEGKINDLVTESLGDILQAFGIEWTLDVENSQVTYTTTS